MLLMLLRLCWLPGSDVSVSGIPGLSYLVEQPLMLLLMILLFGLVLALAGQPPPPLNVFFTTTPCEGGNSGWLCWKNPPMRRETEGQSNGARLATLPAQRTGKLGNAFWFLFTFTSEAPR